MRRVLIADDSDIMRTVIRTTLKDEISLDVIGEAVNFAETVQMVSALRPDIVLLDLHMPDEMGVVPAMIKLALRDAHTIAISIGNDDDSKELARSYGASILLDKMNLYTEMLSAISQDLISRRFALPPPIF